MKIVAIILCTLALVLFVSNTKAQTVSVSQSIILGTGACTDAKVLAKVKPDHHARLSKGHGIWFDRKTYELCWLKEDGRIFVVWEDGTMDAFPAAPFEAGA